MTCANHPDRERVAYCQNCGKPLCQECMRSVGSAIYCEPCLAAKLAGTPASGPGSYPYSDPVSGVYASGTQAGGSYTYQNPATGAYATGPVPPSGPNPALAGLLGLIPGVGAMYNEQYAKGIVHLIVFAVLITLTDQNGIFGLFIAGWIFYMVIEAHHTARARRDGLPLPNPFGLNDLGEKLGFGKAWPSGAAKAAAMPPDPYAASFVPPAPASSEPGTQSQSAGTIPPSAPSYNAGSVPPNWGAPPTPPWQAYVPPVAPIPQVPLDSQVPYPGNRFPAGAIWLIGLGALFLIANAGIFHGFSGRLFVPFFMVGLAVFVFVKKMTTYGGGLSDDGSAGYRWRLFRALRGSIWLALVGLLFFLDEFHILTWGHSWPLFIIVAGVMTVLQRTISVGPIPLAPVSGNQYGGNQYGGNQYGGNQYGNSYGYPPQPAPGTPASPVSIGIVPSTAPDLTHEQEGR